MSSLEQLHNKPSYHSLAILQQPHLKLIKSINLNNIDVSVEASETGTQYLDIGDQILQIMLNTSKWSKHWAFWSSTVESWKLVDQHLERMHRKKTPLMEYLKQKSKTLSDCILQSIKTPNGQYIHILKKNIWPLSKKQICSKKNSRKHTKF